MASFWGQEARFVSGEEREAEEGFDTGGLRVQLVGLGISGVSSAQSGPRDVSMDQVVDIVGSLPDLTEQ